MRGGVRTGRDRHSRGVVGPPRHEGSEEMPRADRFEDQRELEDADVGDPFKFDYDDDDELDEDEDGDDEIDYEDVDDETRDFYQDFA